MRDLSRRQRALIAVLALLPLLALALTVYVLHSATPQSPPTGKPPSGTSGQSTSPPSSGPPGTFNVVTYGADASGQRDATLAIRKAIAAAEQKPGNVVYVPPGRYILNLNDGARQDFDITLNPVTIMGAGRDTTTIVEEIGAKVAGVKTSKVIFQIRTGPGGAPGGADGTSITGLTLDSASYDAGTTIMDFGNNTTISHDAIRGARSSKKYNRDTFGMRVITICNHINLDTHHRSGNIVDDIVLAGQGSAGNTDLDISCQMHTSVSNITDTGNGMDIYIVKDVRVDNYTFRPGTIESSPKSYIITGPADGITLNNVTTYGNGGYIQQSPQPYFVTNTTVTKETMKDLSFPLVIGDANQTTIVDSVIGTIEIRPDHSTTGVTVTTSSVRAVTCSKPSSITGLVGIRC